MLSNYPTATPRRPLPPAKTRKSNILNVAGITPSPLYPQPLEEVLLDSPIPVTAQLINAASQTRAEGMCLLGTSGTDEWMNEKSREELSDLLLKADGIIKSRETELGMTSALCKSLYSDNVTLKTKHEALLARLPGISTPTSSRPPSPMAPAHHAVTPEVNGRAQSPFLPAVAFPLSPDERPQKRSAIKHARRISVTPAELASLSDQNAELIDKLEKLEAESLKADQAGKRKLRKLEEEIQSLRDELERTQVRGIELEAQARAAEAAVSVQKRKEECEAHRQATKDRAAIPSYESSEEGIRDFAPPSSALRTSPIKASFSGSSGFAGPSMGSMYSVERMLADLDCEDSDCSGDPESYPTPPESTRDLPPPEYAIISQLLSKIRELEETNAQIKEEQESTEEQMRVARWDAESIRRVYECLDDQEVEIQDEDDVPGGLLIPTNGTIRFSSLRRTIVGDMSRLMASESDDVFADGISGQMQSTVRESLITTTSAPKARKSVVGLFDSEPNASAEYPRTLQVSPFFRNADVRNLSTWSSSAADGIPPPSPTLSPVPIHMGRTLGSELGSEYGDEWRGVNHHLRTSSLLDLAGMYSSPVSPSESTAAIPTHEEQDTPAGPSPDHSTPPRLPLQLTVQPPTPSPEKLRSPASIRQFHLSQTVRARTNRWVEGRFTRSPSQEALGEKVIRKRASTSSLDRRPAAGPSTKFPAGILGKTFDNAVGKIKRAASRGSFDRLVFASGSSQDPASASGAATVGGVAAAAEEPLHHEGDRSLSMRQDASLVDPMGGKPEGIVGLVIQAWLWLQFIIVVMLFLWAMAKRGPKVVLEAEWRSVHRATSRRQG